MSVSGKMSLFIRQAANVDIISGFIRGKGDIYTMGKVFNVSADCKPELHYMADISGKLNQIKAMVDAGQYFTINRARQYGKTTTLNALERMLKNDYTVINMDFQLLGNADFETEAAFVEAFSSELLERVEIIPEEIKFLLQDLADDNSGKGRLRNLFRILSRWCGISDKKIVLMVDEVDSAANHQVFLDFLAQLRGYYIKRTEFPAFQSVILAGVYDIKNMKQKIRPDGETKVNSPWNTRESNEGNGCLHPFDECTRNQIAQVQFDIAADFNVSMSLSEKEIAGMLYEYEEDNHTGMDIDEMSKMLYDYTAGYPYLVSRLCKLLDEKITGSAGFLNKASVWRTQGFLEAVRVLLNEKNTLFESLMGKVQESSNLRKILCDILFGGQKIVYNPDDPAIDIAVMFGFIKNEDGTVAVANRIFEVRLYNYFLTTGEAQSSPIYLAASDDKSRFLKNGRLDMDTVMRKYVEIFDDIYGEQNQRFDEAEGRRRFLMFIRPIINGSGNYHIEEQTRNARRMDVVIDYLGERFVIELKVWRGSAYIRQGEKQLSDYLDSFHLKKGYMLIYNFNKKKEIGVKEVQVGDKLLVEAVV